MLSNKIESSSISIESVRESRTLTEAQFPYVVPAKPFLPRWWSGDLSPYLPALIPMLPLEFSCYHEVMLGEGAMFFELANNGDLRGKPVFLSDISETLVDTYQVISDGELGKVVKQLDALQKKYPLGSAAYEALQSRFPASIDPIKRAAQLIFTCRDTQSILDPARLAAASLALRSTSITCTDFRDALKEVEPGDLVFIDPPQDSSVSEDLVSEFKRLASAGAHVMLMSPTKTWIPELAAFRQEPVSAHHSKVVRGQLDANVVMSWPEEDSSSSIRDHFVGSNLHPDEKKKFPYLEFSFTFDDHVARIYPLTRQAKTWLTRHVAARPEQWRADGHLVVDVRCFGEIHRRWSKRFGNEMDCRCRRSLWPEMSMSAVGW